MKKIKEITKYSKWWSKEKDVTWAFKKGEDWFLIRNQEDNQVDEPKFKNKKKPENKQDFKLNSYFLWNCVFASTIGIVLGVAFWSAVMFLL